MSGSRRNGHWLTCRIALVAMCAAGSASATTADSVSTSPSPGLASTSSQPADLPAVPICAIIADRTAQAGYAAMIGLLEAKLSGNGGLRLVERDEIDKVLKEQELQLLFAPEGGGRRSALGALLKADLLVLLRADRVAPDKETRRLDLTVCETRSGLRLRLATIKVSDKPEDAALQIAALVDEALAKYRSPVRHVVATPDFVSRDLSHEYDYLKTFYARLVDQRLVTEPELVVVELAEARAIGEELALADKARVVQRQLPFYIMGEYRTGTRGEDLSVSVDLSLRQGSKTLATRGRSQIAQTDALSFMPAAARELLRQAAGETSPRIDPATEAKQLFDRAQVFLRTSNWEEAYRLIEAAILLRPDDPALRREAVDLLARMMMEIAFPDDYRPRLDATDPDAVSEYESRAMLALHYYDVSIQHFERFLDLIDCRQQDAFPANGPESGFWKWRGYGKSATKTGYKIGFDKLHARYQEMLFRVLERKAALSQLGKDALDFFALQTRVMWEPDTDRLRFIRLVQNVPGACGLILRLVHSSADSAARELSQGEEIRMGSELAWLLLDDATTKLIEVIGKMPGTETQKAAGMLRELASKAPSYLVAEEARTLKVDMTHAEESKGDTLVQYRDGRFTITARLKKGELPKRKSETVERKPAESFHLTLVEQTVRFTEADRRDAQWANRGLLGWIPCSPNVDAAWSSNAIFVMRTKGTFDLAYVCSESAFAEDAFEHAALRPELLFDGRYLWAPARNAKEPCLIAIDLQTNKLHRITAGNGVPPMTRGLQIASIGTGRVCVAAAFGKHGLTDTVDRSWCGTVELKPDGSVTADVLLEATKQPDNQRYARFGQPVDMQLVFSPLGLVPLRESDNGLVTQVLLVTDHGAAVVDFKTRAVRPTEEEKPVAWKPLSQLAAFGLALTSMFPQQLPFSFPPNSTIAVHEGIIHAVENGPRRWWVGQHLDAPMREVRLQYPEKSWWWDATRLCASNHYGLVFLANSRNMAREIYQVSFNQPEFKEIEALLQDDARRYADEQVESVQRLAELTERIRRQQSERRHGRLPPDVEAAERAQKIILGLMIFGIPGVAVCAVFLLRRRRSAALSGTAAGEQSESSESRR